ncbi:hypothetical protein AGMMS49531_01470 [Endomicrobiia bacterium]|nr:hypothetical protein AGMMS49531_01470 [Endomicrobiia bacterium]
MTNEHKEVSNNEHQETFEKCKKAAEQGNAAAQRTLGVMYHEGIGIKQGYKEAFYWYIKVSRTRKC